MATNRQPPFSARNRRDIATVDSAFPDTARTGLLHVVAEGVRRDLLPGWSRVAAELYRLARLTPIEYNDRNVSSIEKAKTDSAGALRGLPWDGFTISANAYTTTSLETSNTKISEK